MDKKLLSIIVAVFWSLVFLNNAHGSSETFWTIRVNPKLENASLPIYGLWKPSPTSSSAGLFFGIFGDQATMEKALLAVKKLDPEARAEKISDPLVPTFVPTVRRIALPSLGYQVPLQIRGVRGLANIHIPWSKTSLIKGSRAVFNIKYPLGIFQKPSTLTISVENIPIKVLSLDHPITSPLIIPLELPQDMEVGDFLDISFATSITITGDICTDEQTGNAWVMIEPSSFFEIPYLPTLTTPLDILRSPAERFNIIFTEKPTSGEAIKGIINLATVIGALHPYNRERIVKRSEEYSLTHPNIIVKSSEEDGKIIGRDIISSPKGLLTLSQTLSRFPVPLHQWKSSKTSEDPKRPEFTVRFSDLGINPPLLRGTGELQFSVPFSIAPFKGFPSKLIVTLIYSHTPVAKDEKAFLKVRLNNVLVASKLLTDSTTEEGFSFELPSELLQTRNTLDVIFAYFTNRGECKGSFPEMEVSLSSHSFFSAIGQSFLDTNRFDRFPGVLGGNGIMVLGELNIPFIDLAIGLSEKLGKIRGASLSLDVLSFDQFRSDNPEGSFIIAILKPSQGSHLKPPIDISETLIIKNPQTEQLLLQVETTDNIAVWEIFRNNQGKIVGLLALSESLSRPEFVDTLLDELRIEGSANVAMWTTGYPLFGKEGIQRSGWQVFEVGDKLMVVTPGKKGFSYYWARYRIVLFGFMAVLVFFFLWYVYKKLT
ncbi:MAG: cellulose biosynthesis cyclic di-GMP-binding regulatory protein BcsB [Syntrophobacterales bacterium]|nr:cellulose biosynthesis cyclic di-GMP-binding regulatory protein BcsB [Syntrophobacterales bacterium]